MTVAIKASSAKITIGFKKLQRYRKKMSPLFSKKARLRPKMPSMLNARIQMYNFKCIISPVNKKLIMIFQFLAHFTLEIDTERSILFHKIDFLDFYILKIQSEKMQLYFYLGV